LRAHVDARATASDSAARLDTLASGLERVIEAHRDLQAPQRPVDRLQRALDLGQVRRARPHDELSGLPGKRAAGLDERLQCRKHLVDRPVPQRNDLQRLLGRAVHGAARQDRGQD